MDRYIKCEDFCKEVDKGDLLVGSNAEWAKEIAQRTPIADVVERSVLEKLLDNAMAIPKPMHLYIYFADEHVEKHMVTRFTDLSQTKSQFYYYEEPSDEPGKGKTFRREDIQCFEVSFCPRQNWEQYLTKEKE
ncbi:MAG: hypothetical protein IJZ42_01700 [Lachnospiraceae bacterium]|nr:hypothetical protein [Lachnospiraceae bacterium]